MKRPKLIKKTGKNKHGHSLGTFQCPFCPNSFVARITQVDNDHTTSCGCRKKNNFVLALERKVTGRFNSSTLVRLFVERREGASRKYLLKKYGIGIREFSTAKRLGEVALNKLFTSTQALGVRVAREVLPQQQMNKIEPASHSASRLPLEVATQQTVINVETGGTVNINQRNRELERNVPYEQTEAGYQALTCYWQEHQQSPPDGFDLKAWAQMAGQPIVPQTLVNSE